MTDVVKKTLMTLLELRDIDRDLERVRRRCRECPALIEKSRLEMEDEGEIVEKKKEEIQNSKVKIDQMEMELKSCEERIAKLSQQLLTAKTNQEYRAFQDQIDHLGAEKGEYETTILEFLEAIEELNRERDRTVEEQEIRKKEYLERKEILEKDLIEYQKEAERLEQERKEKEDLIDLEAMRIYDRVRNALGGEGIVPMENRTCGGCYMSITTNDFNRVFSMKEVTVCQSCRRILYIPECLKSQASS